jgi:2-polyprenyl-3-methyl-5-hydroxy-6-metoxy-1,4-benzoquinol methylase
MTAIDPDAPEGAIFRRPRLEDFSDDAGFDAAVASVSLHHVEALDAAVTTIAGLLRPGGLPVLEEFA